MEQTPRERVRGPGWGIPASASVHAAVLALLIFGFPQLRHQPDESSAIEVEIVQPEELQAEEVPQEKPEEKAAATEEEKQEEEAKKEDKEEAPREQRPVSEFAEKDEGPKQEAQEADKEQAKAEQPAPPPPPGQQAQEPEEKPAPPQAPQEAKAEEKPAAPPPAPETAEEVEKAEQEGPPPPPQSPEPSQQTEKAESLRALRPVFQFGEEDEGPRIAEDGNTSEEARTAPAGPTEELALRPGAEKTEPAASLVPAPAPAEPAPEERKLHSRKDTGGKVARTAIDGMPRGVRAGELCASELREQLRRAIPPFWPDLLPAYRLDKGNVLQVRKGAFRSAGQWYDLKFRCEIDADATMVLSFDHEVGAPVPRHEWAARGFPAR